MKFIRKILVTILLIAAFVVGAAAGDMLDLDLLPLDKATYDMEILKEQITEKGDTTFVYKIATNPQIAKNLKGHLLLIHGDIDNNVHPGNTMRVVDALIRAGKRFDMLMLPQQRHAFGDMNEYFYWRLVDYFSEHLKGQKETFVDIPKR